VSNLLQESNWASRGAGTMTGRAPIFVLRLRPLPGADPERALRWLLKSY
jgi:hypothetical protein